MKTFNGDSTGSKWTIGKKLMASFMAMAAITMIVALLGFGGAYVLRDSIEEITEVRLPSVNYIQSSEASMEEINSLMRTLSIPGIAFSDRRQYYSQINQSMEEFNQDIAAFEILPQSANEANVWSRFAGIHRDWNGNVELFLEMSRAFDQRGIDNPVNLSRRLEMFQKDHYAVVQQVLHMLHMNTGLFPGGEDYTACNAGRYFPDLRTDNAQLQQLIREFDEPHQRFHQSVAQIKSQVDNGNMTQARQTYSQQFIPAMNDVFAAFDGMLVLSNEALEYMREAEGLLLGNLYASQLELDGLLEEVVAMNLQYARDESERATSNAVMVSVITIIGLFLGVGVALVLGFYMSRSISNNLRRVIDQLNSGADQVNASSEQLSGASQELSESASEQAAGLQQTTSSLEEMSTQTKQTAENAHQAELAVKETEPRVAKGVEAMQRMSVAMSDIQEASQETSKILKTIDDIAFQTNLLALNAAVEAARAGEAGKGFAVVAEEVRNLAQRSAQAAQDTSELIQRSHTSSERGAKVANEVSENLSLIKDSVSQVGTLVLEIAAAGKEQATGISEINSVMTEMDKVVQQNASSSEESASAAEELSSQANELKQIVNQLVELVGRGNEGASGFGSGSNIISNMKGRLGSGASAPRRPVPESTYPKFNSSNGASSKSSNGTSSSSQKTKKSVRELIPLEEDDFSDF
ncbi:MAG: methyl-accepting chemotaxis protein [Balneolia bacterium]|nr:methyl-accepting chemotaxis protein [Balneolia bacterium]